MFNKQELEDIKESLEEISKNMFVLKQTNEELKQKIQSNEELLTSLLNTVKEINALNNTKLVEELKEIAVLRQKFSKAVASFELLHQKIYDRLYTGLNETLKNHQNELKSTTESYKATMPKVKEINDTFSIVIEEVNKFKTIAKTLKETDFELVNHQKNLERLDREKLYLLKKIDTLERMIGKYRRNKN
ncbi:hypothetical protein D6777_04255 [Candidatus Woesearchaeota archaeon]|nr:MAG: hypothetical protein D6777_04255 [Candidatus Woesearchaeota archaeon]